MNKLRVLLDEAWLNLRANPLRSLVTMSGIVWGIATGALPVPRKDSRDSAPFASASRAPALACTAALRSS